jgi:ferric-dicitrate binding protein FerR (iron transport regulator)
MTGQHLTDEQFTELLSGEYPPEASRHMRMCAQCRSEFERVQTSIEDFGALGLLWAEQRPSPRISAPSAFLRAWQTQSMRTAAAVLLAALLFAAYQEKRTQPPAVDPITAATAARSESQLADDNRLMMAIDKEIRWQADSPVAAENLAEGRIHSPVSPKSAN